MVSPAAITVTHFKGITKNLLDSLATTITAQRIVRASVNK